MSSLNKHLSAQMAQKTLESEISGEEVKEIQSMSIELIARNSSHGNFSSTKEKEMRFSFALALAAVLVTGALATAAPMVSDNFSSPTMGSQWTAYYSWSKGVWPEDGVVNTWVGGYDGSRGGYTSTTGYVLSGDFDISIDYTTASYTHGTGLSILLGALTVRDPNNPSTVYCSLQNRSDNRYYDSQWYMMSGVNGSLADHTSISSDDASMRIVRTGSTFEMYAKELGANEWTLLRSGAITTNDLQVVFQCQAAGDGAVTADLLGQWDNFSVPEPASIMVFCSAAALMIRKRRMA